MVYVFLALAILFEIVGLTALKETNGFTRLVPALIFIAALGASFYFEALALRTLPIGLTYAVWAGIGIVGMATTGYAFYGEKITAGMLLGLALIVAGVFAINYWAPLETAAPGDARPLDADQP